MKKATTTLFFLVLIAILGSSQARGAQTKGAVIAGKKQETTTKKTEASQPIKNQNSGSTQQQSRPPARIQPVVPVANENRLPPPATNAASPQSGEKIDWDVISSGGGPMISTNYQLDGTLGQTAAGEATSPNYALNSGFWQNFSGPYLCGDADGDGAVNLGDGVFVVTYIFGGGPAPDPLQRFDTDCSGTVNIGDIVYLVQYIFASGPAPCALCPPQ